MADDDFHRGWKTDEELQNGQACHHWENGWPAHVPASSSVAAASAATQAMYTSLSRSCASDGCVAITVVCLRVATFLFSLVAIALMAWGSWYLPGYSLGDYYVPRTKINPFEYSGLRCLFAIDVTVCTCTLLRLVLSIILVSTGRTILSTSMSHASVCTRTIDQVLAYVLLAACIIGIADLRGSVRQSCQLPWIEENCELNLVPFVVMSFLAFICLALSAEIKYVSAVRLARACHTKGQGYRPFSCELHNGLNRTQSC